MNAIAPADLFLDLIDDQNRAGFLTGAKMGLFTGAPTLNRNTVLADLTPPTFTGYALTAITVADKAQNAAGTYLEAIDPVTFQPTAGTGLPQVVTGYFLTTPIATVDTYIGGEYFDAPFVFESTLSQLQVFVQLLVQNLKMYGGVQYSG